MKPFLMIFLIMGIVLLSISSVHGAHLISRRSTTNNRRNDLDITNLANELDKIWVAGPILKDAANYVGEAVIGTDKATNGFLTRFLGGQLPCIVDFNGFHCSGVSERGGAFGVVESLINSIPMPAVFKTITLDSIRIFLIPGFDALTGGLLRADAFY